MVTLREAFLGRQAEFSVVFDAIVAIGGPEVASLIQQIRAEAAGLDKQVLDAKMLDLAGKSDGEPAQSCLGGVVQACAGVDEPSGH